MNKVIITLILGLFSLVAHANLTTQYDVQVKSWAVAKLLATLPQLPLKYDNRIPICKDYTPTAWQQLTNVWHPPKGTKALLIEDKKPKVVQRGVFIRRFFWLVKVPIELESQTQDNERVVFYLKVVNAIGQVNKSGFIIQSLEMQPLTTEAQ